MLFDSTNMTLLIPSTLGPEICHTFMLQVDFMLIDLKCELILPSWAMSLLYSRYEYLCCTLPKFIVPNAVQTWPQQQSTAIHEKNIHPKPSCHGTASVGRLDSNLCWTWSHIYSFVPRIRLLEVARGSHPLTKPRSFQARKWVWRLMKVSACNKA